MNRVFILSIICVGLLAARPVAAQSGKLGLMDVYSLAKERDAIHAADRFARDAGVEKAEQGQAALLPLIRLEAGAGYTDQNVTYKGTDILRGGHTNYPGGTYAVTLAQPLFRMQNWALMRQGQAAARMAESAYSLSGQDLIQRVAGAYFNILLAQNTIDLINAQKEAISEHLARAKRSFEVGAASITDTHEAQARYDLALSREILARHGLLIAREELYKIIGQDPAELKPLREDFTPASPEPGNIEKWTEDAARNSPYLKLKQDALAMAEQERAKAQGERLPSADLLASYSYLNQGGSNFGVGMENTSQSVNLRISVPLYTGGALSSRVREARANEEKARQELEEASRQTRLWVRGAFLQVVSAQAEVTALQQALFSSQSALNSTRQGFEVGLRSAVDALDAQQQYFDAKHSLARAKYNYLLNLLRLKASAGALDEEGLRQISGYIMN